MEVVSVFGGICMIRISFRRKSVCMGDDAMNGVYQIEMPDDALLRDLMHITLHGGRRQSLDHRIQYWESRAHIHGQ